jgi:hypothetical protein
MKKKPQNRTLVSETSGWHNRQPSLRAPEVQQQKDDAKAMWLDCLTQEQIAECVGVDHKTISNWVGIFRQLSEFTNPPESRQHFDVWNFAIPKDEKTNYFGAMPPQVVENLSF